MKNFNWEDFKNEKVIVMCGSEEKAKDFVKKAHENGMRWCDDSGETVTCWDSKYSNKIYYYGKDNLLTYGSSDRYKQENESVINWELNSTTLIITPKFNVGDEVFTVFGSIYKKKCFNIYIERINIKIDKNIKYIGYVGIDESENEFYLEESELFSTKEEASQRCKELNQEPKTINLNQIKITKDFRHTYVTPKKVQQKLNYFIENGKFEKKIILNKQYELVDGYITYLLMNLLDLRQHVEVLIQH